MATVAPQYAVSDQYLVPVSDYPHFLQHVPTSRMFVIRKALQTYLKSAGPGASVYDASQGDGGESLPGVPKEILQRAAELQCEVGTAYDTPAGHPRFLKAVAENYWHLDSSTGWGTGNVLAVQGGRDGLIKAFSAMIYCGRGRIGDAIITSAVPWITYNWAPYIAGLNVLRAPGDSAEAWAYTEDALTEAVQFAQKTERHVAGLILTSPDNPTGRTVSLETQIALAQKALSLGVAYVLFDWMYHWVREGSPHDVNVVLNAVTPEQRKRLIFLDGLTKSLGGSNIRNCHLLASSEVVSFVTSHASHAVIPSFFSQAVAITAYEMGYQEACKPIVEPTNQSRRILDQFLSENGYEYIMGDGYYAFINLEKWIQAKGLNDAIEMGAILAEQFGVATVPGPFFSPAANTWIRFSYALPPERTAAAVARIHEALSSMV